MVPALDEVGPGVDEVRVDGGQLYVLLLGPELLVQGRHQACEGKGSVWQDARGNPRASIGVWMCPVRHGTHARFLEGSVREKKTLVSLKGSQSCQRFVKGVFVQAPRARPAERPCRLG